MRSPFTSGETTILRKRPQGTTWYIAVHNPEIVWQGDVFDDMNESPASMIPMLTNSGNILDIKRGMTIINGGNVPGGSWKGRVRVRKDNDGTASAIQIAELGQGAIAWSKFDNITVLKEYRPWAYYKRIDPSAPADDDHNAWVMDWDIEYDNQYHTEMMPHVIMGPPAVVVGNNSHASFVATSSLFYDGSFSSASWSFDGGSPIPTSTGSILGTEDAPVVATFPQGRKGGTYAELTVTDSNGITHTGRRLVFQFNSYDEASKVQFATISGGARAGGYKAEFTFYGGQTAKFDDIQDGAEVVIFEGDTYYGDSTCNLGGNYPYRSNIVFRGWLMSDTVTVNPYTNMVTIQAETINGIISRQENFDVFVFNDADTSYSAASKWTEMYNATIDKILHFQTHWHSNIADITDVNFAGSHASRTDLFWNQNLPAGNMWQQIQDNYKSIFGTVSADLQSSLYAWQDIIVTGNISEFSDIYRFDREDKADALIIPREPIEKVAKVELYSLFGNTEATVEAKGAQHPGGAPNYFGGKQEISKGIFADAESLREWVGNYRAALNNPYDNVTMPLANYIKLDPVPQSLVRMSLSGASNPKGIDWNNTRFLPWGATLTYNSRQGRVNMSLNMSEYVAGTTGGSIFIPELVDDDPDPLPDPDDLPDIPDQPGNTPGDGLGTVYVMDANALYRTRDFSASPPTWTDISGATTGNGDDFLLDPFYPATRAYFLTSTGLYRSTDMDQVSPTWSSILTKTEMQTLSGVTLDYLCNIEVSINVEDFIGVAASEDKGGIASSWLVHWFYSRDAGTTWNHAAQTWNQVRGTSTHRRGNPIVIAPHLDSSTNDIVCYSTKPRSAVGGTYLMKSTNAGATWSQSSAYVSGGEFGFSSTLNVMVPYDDNPDNSLVYPFVSAFFTGTYYYKMLKWTSMSDPSPSQLLTGGIGNIYHYSARKCGEESAGNRLSMYVINSTTQQARNQLYVSSDGGTTLTQVTNTDFPVNSAFFGSGGFPYNASQFYGLIGHPSNGTLMGVWLTTDGGNNWVNKSGATSFAFDEGRATIMAYWLAE